MLQLRDLTDDKLQGLEPQAVMALAQRMLLRLREQAHDLEQRDAELQRRAQAIQLKDAKIEKITLELALFKRWKFGAKTEAMSAEQRRLFEETCAEDEAALQAQLDELCGQQESSDGQEDNKQKKRRPRREPLPDHLRRVEHQHEPANTHCPRPHCGQPMSRIGEDVSEKLDIVPAEFFVHRHIYGKWACRCCQRLVQEPAEPCVIDGGIPAAGLVAHTLISRCVDHLPYYRPRIGVVQGVRKALILIAGMAQLPTALASIALVMWSPRIAPSAR